MTDALPDAATCSTISKLKVQDQQGTEHELSALLPDGRQTLAIFIRHFRCGLCQDYLVYLMQQAAIISPEALKQRNAQLIVIGCGDSSMIKPYKELLDLPYEVYANPSASLYKALGMNSVKGLDTNVQSVYAKKSFMGMVASSAVRAVKMGNYFGSAGSTSQLGGELILFRDAYDTVSCSYCHRMKSLSDHSEAPILIQALPPVDTPTVQA